MAGMDHAPPGFRFKPTREELISFYLDPWVADPGKTPVGELQGIVCVADVYREDPAALTSRHRRFGHDDGNWYFLCVARWKGGVRRRASRVVKGGGKWHGYGKRVAVARAGHRQTFEYRDARGRKTAWLMEEFGTVLPEATDGAGVSVLCRVHQTTRTADEEERGESSKAARSSKRRRRGEEKHDMAADAKDEQLEPLEQVIAKDEPAQWEMVTMEDEPEPLEHFEAEPWEILSMEEEPKPLDTLTTKNMPPIEQQEPLEGGKILTKEDEPEPLEAESPTTTTTTAFDQDSGATNKESTSNAEMEMPADAEWNYQELFEQREPPPMEDVMKPLPAPTVQEFEQGAPPPAIQELEQGTHPAAVQEFGVAAWGGHGRRCLVRPISLPGF